MKIKLGLLIKRFIFTFGIIYGINLILNNIGIQIPINMLTLLIPTFLGVPGLLSIFFIFYMVT